MKVPRFSDIPIVYKISLPQAFALVILGSIAAFMVGSQQRQTVVLDSAIKVESLQTQLAAASQSITAANNEFYVLTSRHTAGGSLPNNQKSLKNVLGDLDDVRVNLLSLRPELSSNQLNSVVAVLQGLVIYRGGVKFVGSMNNADLPAAPSFIQPFEAIYARMTTTLNETSQDLAATTAEQAKESVRETNLISKVMFTLIAGTLLLTMTLTPLIITAVQRAVILICEATVSLAAGKNDVDLARLERGDEFGAIVRSMIIFREDQYRIIALHAEREAMEAQREATRIDQERITCMISALSATNEAILRAETRGKLFQLVCEAAVLGGKFSGACIALPAPAGDCLRFVATNGPIGEFLRDTEMPLQSALS